MRRIIFIYALNCLVLVSISSYGQQKYPANSVLEASDEVSTRLSNNYMPVIGAWFWSDEEFSPDGYKSFIDYAKIHSPYNLLTTSLRVAGKEIVDADVRNQIKLRILTDRILTEMKHFQKAWMFQKTKLCLWKNYLK